MRCKALSHQVLWLILREVKKRWSIIIQVVNKQAKGSDMGKVNLRGARFTKGDKNAQSKAPVSLSFPIFANTWVNNSSGTRSKDKVL